MTLQVEIQDLRRMLKEKCLEIFNDENLAYELFLRICEIEEDDRFTMVEELLKEQEVTQKDWYNLQELWKRARTGETLNETELNFLLADWDERNIFKQQEM